MHKPLRTLVSASILGVLATNTVQAGAFSLYSEGSAAAIGNYAAGIAAEGADASIGWYNPAGLVLIREQQAVFGGVGVFPTVKLSGTSTFSTNGLPDYVQTFDNLSGGENALVPSFHYAKPLGENAAFGLSVVTPFGLGTNWDTTSPVRYQATATELMTSTVSPEISGKLSENFSIGGGIDLQYARVKFNRMLGAPTLYQDIPIPGLDPFVVDSQSYNKGQSFGVGFHAGALAMFNDNHTRIGLNYQSKVRHHFHGYSILGGRLADPELSLLDPLAANINSTFKSNDLNSNVIDFPDIVTLSGYHDVNQTIALLGSVVFTNWGTLKTLELNNVAAVNTTVNPVRHIKVNSVSEQNYASSGAWRVAVGANYHVNPNLMLRVGGGFDATPTNDVDRDARLPDTDRWALSIGAHYQARPNIGVDVGYTHLFAADDARVNRTDNIGLTSTYNVNATGKTGGDLVGAQLVWTIDPVIPPVTK
ncbi:OmpP1/FadL family transporter [Legionella worsleiensis]|uniref:Long chain fatty acid transporter n=1 Tax=Legionella worsleiensis TaxID=45076 RepID=A0A0W1AIM7_9GAMM|nr:OmpP1/FadL family transporter [Legionella worsleiensis]KTD81223.1 long chain fatty acid transporter [Legionella worsleiensis]STY33200.1 long chain fatty acid transporter [Legionella worsleiensis]